MDLESKGCIFTWVNNCKGQDFVKKRLDRAVCSIYWRVLFPEAEVYALPAIGSDYSSLLMVLSAEKVKRKKIFKFEAFWLEHEECGSIIKRTWNLSSLKEANLVQKIRVVAAELAKWSKENFQNSYEKIKLLKEELQGIVNSQVLPTNLCRKKRTC